MIYIIDEKTKRQESYGWNAQRFEKFKGVIIPINDYLSFESEGFADEVLSEGNVVLFHESFFNGIAYEKSAMAKDFIHKLDGFGQIGIVVYYGGSKSSRKVNGNVAFLPVSVMYQHLETYLNKTKEGNADINYLIWGENPMIEKYIIEETANANEKMLDDLEDYDSVSCKALVIVSSDKNQLYIPDSNPNITIKELFPDNEADEPISDRLLHSYVVTWLQEKEYDSIVLPLCFGPVLSDYNGLRLAMHIRCTQTLNRHKPIYLYGVVGLSNLIYNEYFDVLRTKGVFLIDYDNKSILSSLTDAHEALGTEMLSSELKKVKLNLPENYIDSHSIANEWAIYRWAKTIGTSDADINEVVKNVETNLYFKYLNTIYPISSSNQLNKNNLIISTNCKNKPKVLLVDDEAKKGWFQIFCSILKDANGFYFDHLDNEFNEKSSDEIVQIVHEKVVSEDIDIVVLDYRLHRSDYFAEHIKDVTGYKVLYDIKNHINPGIQVIVLSATNKIWNLRALQKDGANEFVLKESPSESINEQSAVEEIDRMVKSFTNCCEKVFLKKFYKDYFLVNSFLQQEIKNKSFSSEMFVKQVLKWLKLSCDVLKNEVNDQTIASSYLFMFSVLENAANVIIDTDPKLCEDENNKGRFVYRYLFKGAGDSDYLMRFNGETCQKTKHILEYEYDNLKTIPWIQKLLNAIDRVGANNIDINFKHLIDVRNDFIHANSSDAVKALLGEEVGIKMSELIELQRLVCHFLNNIK